MRVYTGARVRACINMCSPFVVYNSVARQMTIMEMATLINVLMYDVKV